MVGRDHTRPGGAPDGRSGSQTSAPSKKTFSVVATLAGAHHGRARLQGPNHINASLKRHQWHRSVTTNIEEALGELGPEFATRMFEWREWLDKRPRSQADSESCASMPGWGDWPRRPLSVVPVLLVRVPPTSLVHECLRAQWRLLRREGSHLPLGMVLRASRPQKRTRLATGPAENQG